MAELTIRFRHNSKTGKRELVISYESDSDALAHERDHRAMVERLLGVPLGDDEIVVERVEEGSAPEREAEQGAVETPRVEKNRG